MEWRKAGQVLYSVGIGDEGQDLIRDLARSLDYGQLSRRLVGIAAPYGETRRRTEEWSTMVIDLGPSDKAIVFHMVCHFSGHGEHRVPVVTIDEPINRSTVEEMLQNPDRLYQMTPRNFERFVCELFRGLGYKTTLTGATRDGGVDILAEKIINGMPHRYVVQCKHTRKPKKKLGVAYARELLGVLADRAATAGILVSNALFSKETLQFLKRNAERLFGFDLQGLITLMREYLLMALLVEVVEAKG
jgi:HJR/Mrr/RecB family endonuclease